MMPNWSNRTLWTGDNLDIMRGMNSASVDLIYLDPPFNSNRDYAAPIGSEAAGAAFKDTWSLSDVDEAWQGEVADREPTVYAAIDAAGLTHGKGMKSYLIMMAVRLLRQAKPWRGGCHELKPLVAIQRVRLPPGKGAARQPEASLAWRAVTPVVKRRQQVMKRRRKPRNR